jgi:hypothetical protein
VTWWNLEDDDDDDELYHMAYIYMGLVADQNMDFSRLTFSKMLGFMKHGLLGKLPGGKSKIRGKGSLVSLRCRIACDPVVSAIKL